MTRTLIAALLAATAFAAPAAASSQLARALDVAPGTATVGELITLRSALENNDRQTARVIRQRIEAGASGVTLSTRGAAPQTSELGRQILLRSSLEDGERHVARQLRKAAN
ncbi:MAG: hypothetical protein AAFR47_21300 [Pseudomonadota bacterium]